MIDFIYHEHVSYFSCQDFINLGEKFGLDLVEIRRVGLKGGSIQAIFRTKSSRASVSGDVGRLAQYEEWVGIRHASWFADINDRIKKAQSETHRFLDAVKADKIAGYGVSHSVTTLIYQFDLVDRIKVLTDDNPRLHGVSCQVLLLMLGHRQSNFASKDLQTGLLDTGHLMARRFLSTNSV